MSDDIDDRLSKRFGDETDSDEPQPEQTDMSSTSQNDSTEQNSQNAQNSSNNRKSQNAQNVKKEWNVRSFYLDDELNSELTTAFKRLDLGLSEAEIDLNLKKTRHFYPLIVELGLEQLESMDTTEVTERLESE